jgi:hypothetical protein
MLSIGPVSRIREILCLLLLCVLSGGCGKEMKVAPVSGTVTLDGAPLDRASVMFLPAAGGRPSFGVTDEQGRFTLDYSMDQMGAEVGQCDVKISTKMQAADDADDEGKFAPERVPKRYLGDKPQEPIIVTVEPKDNTIDIALTTKR